ncbi:MAG: hypothetical protein ACTS2F_03490 [Thainema sp.]
MPLSVHWTGTWLKNHDGSLIVILLAVAASEIPAIISKQSVVVTEKSVIATDFPVVVPDKSATLPDKSVLVAEKSATPPDKSATLTDFPVVAPDKSATLPDISATLFRWMSSWRDTTTLVHRRVSHCSIQPTSLNPKTTIATSQNIPSPYSNQLNAPYSTNLCNITNPDSVLLQTAFPTPKATLEKSHRQSQPALELTGKQRL